MQSALDQVRNGLKHAKEWKIPPTASTPKQLHSPGTQDLGNSELLRAFSCLDSNSIMIIDAVPVETVPKMGLDEEDPARRVPQKFSSREEARAQLEVSVSRMLHWVASAYVWGTRAKEEVQQRKQPTPDFGGDTASKNRFQNVLDEKKRNNSMISGIGAPHSDHFGFNLNHRRTMSNI
jgi:hypothetical protein